MNLTSLALSIVVALFFGCALAKPVNRGPPHPQPPEANSPEERFDLGLHYEHYLKQVVEELEKDVEFKKKLDSANLTDIKSGKIASYLELVNHTIRTRLDELKRKEIQRLRELVRRTPRRDVERFQVDHLNKKNIHSFEVDDLKALIQTATQDLENLDEERRKEFKQHEMDKEAHRRQKLEHMQPEERKKEEEHMKELDMKHKDHPKMHHPGSKDQLEEVWEKSDHLQDQDFDPKTFFMKHDLNGDFLWDEEEIDSVLQVELDKVYDPENPEEDDPWEREEEMNRMREHIMKEMDKDNNKFITMEEFLAYTGLHGENPEFQKDEGWQTIDEQDPVYTQEELDEYLKQFDNQPGLNDLPPHDLKFQPGLEQNLPPAGQQQPYQPGQQQHPQLSQEQLQQQLLELQQKFDQQKQLNQQLNLQNDQQVHQQQQLNQQQAHQQQQLNQQQVHQQQLNQQQVHQQQQEVNQQQVHQQQPPQQQQVHHQQPPQQHQQNAPQQGQMPSGH